METTKTQIPNEVNNFYDRTMLVRATPYLAHTQFGQVRDIPAGGGTDTIKFRRYGNLTAATTALTEGVTPNGSQLSVTDITAQVLQYGDYVTLTDLVDFTTVDPVLTETAELFGDQVGDTLDQLARDVMVAGTTVQYASTATARTEIAAAMKLTATDIRKAVRTLQNANAQPLMRRVDPTNAYSTVPLAASYVAIITPSQLFDIKSDTAFVPVNKYPSQADVMPGEKGSVDDVRLIVSTNAKVYATGGAGGTVPVHIAMILARDYYGITRIAGHALENIIKPLGSAGTADPLNQRATSGWKATFVAKRLNENFAVRLETGVTA